MTILFYNEETNIKFIGLDQRKGEICPPLGLTIAKVSRMDVRPRGADIVDVVLNGDTVNITANGNGTGTVTVAVYIQKADDPAPFRSLAFGSGDRFPDGNPERNPIGSKSLINTIGIAFSEEVTVVEPKDIIELKTDVTDPEPDCQE